MRRTISAIATALLLPVALAGPAMADAFQNGSFEDGAYVANSGAPLSFMAVPPGSTVITGWDVGGANGIDWKETLYWEAAHGVHSFDLNHLTAGSVSQTFTTNPGRKYRVDFMFSGNPVVNSFDCPPAGFDPRQWPGYSLVKTMTVRATGGQTKPYAFDTTPHSWEPYPVNIEMTWRPEVYRFTATGKTTTLTFTSTSVGPCGPALDFVRVGTATDCKKGGWKSLVDTTGSPFRSAAACRRFYK